MVHRRLCQQSLHHLQATNLFIPKIKQIPSAKGGKKVASLEKCMDKLTEANLEQSTVRTQLFVSGQLTKITFPTFNDDPLQYPVWKSAFNALVDSRPMEADIKLNMLNQ